MRNPFHRTTQTSGHDWLISCGPANPKWQVTVGNCDKTHAESVLAQLKNDPSCPDDLTLKRI